MVEVLLGVEGINQYKLIDFEDKGGFCLREREQGSHRPFLVGDDCELLDIVIIDALGSEEEETARMLMKGAIVVKMLMVLLLQHVYRYSVLFPQQLEHGERFQEGRVVQVRPLIGHQQDRLFREGFGNAVVYYLDQLQRGVPAS